MIWVQQMKFEVKLALILLAASAVFKAVIEFTEFEMPTWVTWLALALWLPILVWFVVKLPSSYRRDEKQKNAAINKALLTTDSRAETVSHLDNEK